LPLPMPNKPTRPKAQTNASPETKSGWRRVRFEEMAENIGDRVDNPSQAGVERYVGLEHLDPESLKIRRWGTPDEVEATKLRFQPGDIIFGKRRAYQRKLAVADFEGICSAHAMVFRAREDTVVKEFLPVFMQSEVFFERALSISVGSLSPTINWKTLAAQEFVIPPKDEQRRIAEILWAAGGARVAFEDAIPLSKRLKQILLDEVLQSDRGGTRTLRLEKVCEMQNGRSFSSGLYQDTGIKLLRPGNLGAEGYFDWRADALRCLPSDILSEAERYVVNPNDVVINLTAQSLEDGFIGRVCLARREEDRSLLNQRIGRFICKETLEPEYLFRCLQTTAFRKTVESSCEGSKIKHLYWRHFTDFEIPLPSRQEQQRVAKMFRTVEVAMDAAVSHVTETRQLQNKLRADLLGEPGHV